MSCYLFKKKDKVWRGGCSGSCPYGEEWSVLQMRVLLYDADDKYLSGLESWAQHPSVGPMSEQFWKNYQRMLSAMFGYERPAMLEPLFADPAQYRPLIPMTSFTLKKGPKATQHAIWQVLRQVCYRPREVIACVEEYIKRRHMEGVEAMQENTVLALALWHKHLRLGRYQSENFSDITLEQWLAKFNGVVHGKSESRWMENYSSAVFQND